MKMRHLILLVIAIMFLPGTVSGIGGEELLLGTWKGSYWEDNNPGKKTSFTWEIWKDSLGNILCGDGASENRFSPDTTRIVDIENGAMIVAPWTRKDPLWHGEYRLTVLDSNPDAMTGTEASYQGKKVFKQYSYELRRATPRIAPPTRESPQRESPPRAELYEWYSNPKGQYRIRIPSGWTVIDSDEKAGTDILGAIGDISVMLVCDREGIDVAGLSVETTLALFRDSFVKILDNPDLANVDFRGMPALRAVSFDAKKEMTTWTTLAIYRERAYQFVTVKSGRERAVVEPGAAVFAWASLEWMSGGMSPSPSVLPATR